LKKHILGYRKLFLLLDFLRQEGVLHSLEKYAKKTKIVKYFGKLHFGANSDEKIEFSVKN
jgi:hypothetical protein